MLCGEERYLEGREARLSLAVRRGFKFDYSKLNYS